MKSRGQESANANRSDDDEQLAAVLEEVRDALRGLRFGQVSIVVQDGIVVQIDRMERRRIQKRSSDRNDSSRSAPTNGRIEE